MWFHYRCYISVRIKCSSRYNDKFCTRFNDMPPQTRTDPPPNCTVPTILHGAYLSPGRLYTLTRRSLLTRENLDSSLNKTRLHEAMSQSTCSVANSSRALRCTGVRSGPVAGTYGRSSVYRRRLLTVSWLILVLYRSKGPYTPSVLFAVLVCAFMFPIHMMITYYRI
jgi:hypothetical protein